MASRFKRKESVTKGVQRIAQGRINCALNEMQPSDKLEAVHRVRMEIKKLRAILRLMRKAADGSFYSRNTNLLREAANSLSHVRDTHVTLKALNDLVAHFKGQLPPRPFKQIKQKLQERCDQATSDFARKSSLKKVTSNLRKVSQNFRQLQLGATGWPALCAGLTWSYSRGRCCKNRSINAPASELLHEWRKRVKDLWYQVRLLRPLWPEQMCAMASELKTLSDLLGDDHDLVMLKEILEQMRPDEQEFEVLCGLITQRQQELRSEAVLLGARFYSEKPAVFVQRLARYWTIWRKGKGKLKRKVRASVTT
ncbi:MAG TPA: CHAD domain-containing protein [Candidatus Limnocylindrales bacterium]|nr:CHAD domain-containing protein [Candidatus Limnocylindrales bacterium]